LDIDETKNSVKLKDTDSFLVKKEGDFIKISFFDLNKETRRVEPRKSYITLQVHTSLNPIHYINHWANDETNSYGYSFLRDYSVFKKIVTGINSVKINSQYKGEIKKVGKNLLIHPKKFKELKARVEQINKIANSSRNSLLTYLTNQARFDFLNKRTQRTTSSAKGDFDFLIHRLNLTTKKTSKDFKAHLNNEDIHALGTLFDEMIKKEVFDEKYLRKLDDYFIKEKLEEIIKFGKEISELKSSDIKTKQAKQIIKSHFSENIGQLETVWQKYFEKYLLYLFFSYKKIIPKVELNDLENLDKKYPDFVGVNHYDGVDIIEIKTHLKNVLVWDNSHDNFAFSSEMSKAIIQTINYMDAITDEKFKKTKDRKDLLHYLNIDQNLYRPRGIIIISSKDKICRNQNKLSDDQKKRLKKDFTKLRNSIHNIQIFTFDEILNIAQRYIENIKTE